ncbi:TonB-dependent receptor [Reyranella sp.]|uniref:TonB-dependent receptor n=1 Tax=Reyranella sp. TaxID=1929291 RepID=UPI0037832152
MNKRLVSTAVLAALAWHSTSHAQDQQQQQHMGPRPMDEPGQKQYFLPEGFITATGRPEPISRLVGTVQVIHQDRIAKSTARSVTELLNENAVGFMSEWTPGQTSINIRGASTEGQGRDFKGQVLVLINGHRAGTSNVSKLSTADVERIEIVRGPSSVIYGSQNMGGVINIILKTGLTAPGNFAQGDAGSWGLWEAKVASGGLYKGFDWYVGGAASTRDNYAIGGGATELNTGWTRYGGTGAFGYQIDQDSRIEGTIRTDGIYNAGFRGSSANLFAFDTRYNYSFDLSYLAKTRDGQGNFFVQAYFVTDVDDLNNPSPLSALNAPASRTTTDHNRRQLDVLGLRFQPRYKFFTGNELLVGIDLERSWLRSDRYRAGGSAVTQVSPQDNNQTDSSFAFYLEDSQSFLDDRLIVRGGVRQTWGDSALDWTPYAPTLIPGTNSYNATTYSAGATFAFTDWLSARAGASSGFRAPTATEIGANFTTTPIGTTIFGNPSLVPETSQQWEAGATANWRGGRFDAVVFQNTISNRITPVTVSSTGGRVVQVQVNSPANLIVQGIEFQTQLDVLQTAGWQSDKGLFWNVFGNGYYNFNMTDYGANPLAGTNIATRINKYGMSIGTLFGQAGTEIPWSFQLLGILRGPMWYNTEESLSPVFFPGQNRTVSVYEKGAFWVWNTRAEVEVRKGIKLFAAVNNLFDVNNHPIFIAQDSVPCTALQANQNGACGNSMPGREVIGGFQFRF